MSNYKIKKGRVIGTKRNVIQIAANNGKLVSFDSVAKFNRHFGLTQATSRRILEAGSFNNHAITITNSNDIEKPELDYDKIPLNHKYVAWDDVNTHSFVSIATAVKLMGVSRQAIHSALHNDRPTCHGYYWSVL